MSHFRLFPTPDGPEDRIDPGIWLLEASAGTGKTYVIAGLVARLVVEDGLPLERIAVMTFTRAATAQLRERIRSTLSMTLAASQGAPCADPFINWLGGVARRQDGIVRLRTALDSLDASPITTIHGFCQRLLTTHGLSLGTPSHVDLGREMTGWRSAWCRDRIRQWAEDPALGDWLACGLLPTCDDLEKWTGLLERYPDCLLPEPGELPAYADLRSALAQARSVFAQGRIGSGDIARQRQASFLALDTGQGTRHDLKILVELSQLKTLVAKAPELIVLGQHCATILEVGTTLEIRIVHAYQQALRQRLAASDGKLVYLDLLTGIAEGLRSITGHRLAVAIGNAFDAVLVDEFQDTDALQWEILQRCFGSGNHRLVLIGDPKQAIYSFRGADVETYLAAKQVVDGSHQRSLGTNYRSDRSLHRALQALLGANPDPFCHPGIALEAVAAQCPDRMQAGARLSPEALQLHAVDPLGENDQNVLIRTIASGSARLIRELLESGSTISQPDGTKRPVIPQDITVLVHSHDQAGIMRQALQGMGIAAVTRGRDSILATLEALEIRALLHAWMEPHDPAAINNAALTRLGGITPAQLIQGEAQLASFAQACATCGEAWHAQDILTAWYAWMDQSVDRPSELAAVEGGERALVNYMHLIELLAVEQHDAQRNLAGLVTWFEERISSARFEETDDHLLPRLDRDDAAVRIETVHASKGLQFPIVVLPFAWVGRPWSKPKIVVSEGGKRTWIAGAGLESTDPRYYQERLAEQARVLYVALTRAEHRCVVVWCGQVGDRGLTLSNTASMGSSLGMLLLGNGEEFQEMIRQWGEHADQLTSLGRERASGIAGIAIHDSLPGDGQQRAHIHPLQAQPEWLDDPGAISVIRSGTRRERWPSSYSGLVRRIESDQDHDIDIDIANDGDVLRASNGAYGPADEQQEDGMPSGAAFGIAMHAVFELALRREDPLQDFEGLASRILAQQGVSAQAIPAVVRAITRFLTTSLPGGSTPLARIPMSRRGVELPFALPVLEAADLAKVFAQHPLPGYPRYAQRLEGVCLPPGLFTGVIDLVVQDGGVWHIVDWKSNTIMVNGHGGAGVDDQALRRNMRDHHYPVQYALYGVALRRLLKQRLGVRNPPLGFCHYAYVRYGRWVSEAPSAALLDALDAAMDGTHG